MTPAQAIQTATMVASEMMGWHEVIEAIQKGKFFVIIAVSADPLKDIRELGLVKFVIKGGQLIRNDLN